jgi:hypothetical protein
MRLTAAIPPLSPLDRGILWPVVYASIFGAAVPEDRLWSRLVGVRATKDEMRRALRGPTLSHLLSQEDGHVWLRSSTVPGIAGETRRRARVTADLLVRHRDILAFVRNLPGVRLAALSGGCAHEAADDGDIDIFVVTDANALWRTLLHATLVAKARGWRRLLCLNYLVDESAQGLPWRDFYGGYELISLKPLTSEAGLEDLLAANPWVDSMFPNFPPSRGRSQNPPNQNSRSPGSRLLEVTARMIQRPYLRYRLPSSTGVELSDHVVRLHTTDHRTRLRGLFQDALLSIGMEAPPWI